MVTPNDVTRRSSIILRTYTGVRRVTSKRVTSLLVSETNCTSCLLIKRKGYEGDQVAPLKISC